ncbi:hypothetical protein ACHQM5_013552 [Ranunculus cassubicifolius]
MPPNLIPLLITLFLITSLQSTQSIGVNWGTSSSHPLPPDKVIQLLKSNKINKVKLFDADPLILQSLSGTKIDVTVGIPNGMLRGLSLHKKLAENWVHDNLTRYFTNGGDTNVRIQYIAVGNEPFLQSYGKQFQPFVIGAVTNIQIALTKAKLDNKVKVVVPCHSDAFLSESGLPSKGHFRPDLNKTMIQILTFLTKNRSPFFVNMYPFLSIHQNKNTSLDFVLFKPTAHSLNDTHKSYKNTFDLTFDTLVSALTKLGFPDIDIAIGQIGWPTDGALNASSSMAQSFMKGLMNNLQSNLGTPLRPKKPPNEVFIFSLLDEDQRSMAAGNFERHWGLFTFDGQAKYNVYLGQGTSKLVNAQNVDYLPSKWCVVNNNKDMSNVTARAMEACSVADCTELSPGGSCFNISWPGNISYAFNSFYQMHDQKADSCDFGGLGLITTVDPSMRNCRFLVELHTSASTSLQWSLVLWWRFVMVASFSVCILCLA